MQNYKNYINLKKEYFKSKKYNQKGGVILNTNLEKINFLRLLSNNIINNNYELFEKNYNSVKNINTFINSAFILEGDSDLIFGITYDQSLIPHIESLYGQTENIYKIIIMHKPTNIEKYFLLLLNNYKKEYSLINYLVKLGVAYDNIDMFNLFLNYDVLEFNYPRYIEIIKKIFEYNSYYGYIDLYKFVFSTFNKVFNKKVSKHNKIDPNLLLHQIIWNNDTNLIDVFELFLKEKFKVDINILMKAIDANKPEIIHLIFSQGNVQITDYIIDTLRVEPITKSLLYYAAEQNRATIFEILYNLGGDINDPTPNTPLSIALEKKCIDTLKFMLSTNDLKFVAKNDLGELVHISKVKNLERYLQDNDIIQVFTEAGKLDQLQGE